MPLTTICPLFSMYKHNNQESNMTLRINAKHSLPKRWASLVAQSKEPTCQCRDEGDTGLIPGSGRSKGMATHSSMLAGKIPWTEAPGRLQSMGSQRVGHNWSDWIHPKGGRWGKIGQRNTGTIPSLPHPTRVSQKPELWGRLKITKDTSTTAHLVLWRTHTACLG